jgi:CheY-like chemotaxis protein
MRTRKKLRILVVDDSKVVLRAVCQLMTRLGYETIASHDGREALKIMETDNDIDLVITDINMPRMDGRELALHIKSKDPGMPIIALTGEHPNNILPMLHGSGISQALFKPLDMGHLNDAMALVLQSR